MANAAAVKEKPAEAEEEIAAPKRALKPIPTSQIQRREHVGRRWVITLSPGMVAQDLQDSANVLFKNGQGNPSTAMKTGDEVKIYEAEKRWAIYADVGFADPVSVVLCGFRKVDYPEPPGNLYQDDTYRVEAVPGGYAVFRRKENVRMTHVSLMTPDAAKAALLALYPKKTAVTSWA